VFCRGSSGGEGGKKHPKGVSFLLFSSRFSGHEKKRLPPTVDCQKSMHLSSSATKANNLRFVIVSPVVICYLLFVISYLLFATATAAVSFADRVNMLLSLSQLLFTSKNSWDHQISFGLVINTSWYKK